MISAAPTARPVAAARPRPVAWARLAWVTQRQRRGVVIGTSVVLGLFALYLLVMAIIQNNAYAAAAACHPAAALKCQSLAQAFSRDYWGGGAGRVIQSGGAQTVSSLMFALPVLLGAFAGAPLLAREFESGTYRFAWTQGAGRTRWAVSTLVLPAAALTAAAGAFTALFYWYFRPFLADGQVSEMLPLAFALLGVAFAAWTLFAFALSAFLGTLLRRTLPAIAVTLVAYIALAIGTATAIRQHYMTPVTTAGWNGSAGAGWVIASYARSPSGQILGQGDMNSVVAHMPASVQNSQSPDAFTNWLTQHGYTLWQSVQPNSRFWEFQLVEGGWLLAVSALLIGATVWLVRRRGA
jgi:ABC-type transport system involved in multi-copper enzyme maturation permease subunit